MVVVLFYFVLLSCRGGPLSFAVDKDGEEICEMSAIKAEFKCINEKLEIFFYY